MTDLDCGTADDKPVNEPASKHAMTALRDRRCDDFTRDQAKAKALVERYQTALARGEETYDGQHEAEREGRRHTSWSPLDRVSYWPAHYSGLDDLPHPTLLSRRKPTPEALALGFAAWRDGVKSEITWSDLVQHYVPTLGSLPEWQDREDCHLYAIEDRDDCAPRSFDDREDDDAARERAEAYRERLPRELRAEAMRVYFRVGQPTIVLLWSACPISDAEVRSDCERFSDDADDEPRFRPATYPLDIDYMGVHLPAVRRPRESLRDLSRRQDRQAGPTLDTGLPVLDRQFRAGGIPMGARVVLGGPPGAGKTTIALHLASQAGRQGWLAVWVAYDESADDITARLEQRPEPRGELEILDRPRSHYENIAAVAAEAAEGRPVLIVIDSIQKLRTRAGEGRGERERIDAAIDAIQECQARYPALVVMTSEIARGTGATKGSGAIDYGATVDIRVRRSGCKLALSITKNRAGTEEPFGLMLDADRQTLADPNERDAAERGQARDAEVWARIQSALPARSVREIVARTRSKTDDVRACVRRRVDSGELLRTSEGSYQLP